MGEKRFTISRRNLLKSAAVTAAALPFVGPNAFGSFARAQGTTDLSIWTWYLEQQDEFPKLDAEFNAQFPNIRAESRIYNQTEYLQLLPAAVAGGSAPDIFGPHVYALNYGEAGQIVDLNEVMGEEFVSQFFPSTRSQFSVGNKQYAVGWMSQTFGFFYNPPLLEQVGATPPETWDELIEVAGELKAAGLIPWTFNEADKWLGADFFLPLITQVTDDTSLVYKLDAHEGDVSWNSEPVVEALELVDRLVKASVFQEGTVGTNWDQSLAIFYSGRAAMMFAGSWVPQGIAQNASPEFAETYRVFKTPALASGKRHWTGNQAGAALSIYAHGDVEAAAEYLRFIYDTDRYARTMNNSLAMPSTDAAASQVSDPIMKTMTSWLPDGAPHILYGQGSWDAVSNAVQGVFAQTLTPAEAAQQMEQDVIAARKRSS